MTIYDMVYEEEQSTLYAALLGPAGPDSQVSFSCHLRRGGPPSESPSYELIHFVGYFRKFSKVISSKKLNRNVFDFMILDSLRA